MNSHSTYPFETIFSVDVEDWFHILDIPSAPALPQWAAMPSRVEANFYRLLDMFSQADAQVTCFFLGWIGERFPHLVKAAVNRGHEIASHGYAHRLVYEMTRQQFYEDASHSRKLLEDISGTRVLGYRSAGFSLTERTPWFFDALAEAGYYYDSSVFPARRGHGGMGGAQRTPHIVGNQAKLLEFPMTVVDLGRVPMCFFGGGYLRLFPYWLVRSMARKALRQGCQVVFYVHPREIDPRHPHLPMKWQRRLKSYVNLRSTEQKILRILSDFPVTTFRSFLASHPGRKHVALQPIQELDLYRRLAPGA